MEDEITKAIKVLKNLRLYEAARVLEKAIDNEIQLMRLRGVIDSFPVDVNELINNYELDTE